MVSSRSISRERGSSRRRQPPLDVVSPTTSFPRHPAMTPRASSSCSAAWPDRPVGTCLPADHDARPWVDVATTRRKNQRPSPSKNRRPIKTRGRSRGLRKTLATAVFGLLVGCLPTANAQSAIVAVDQTGWTDSSYAKIIVNAERILEKNKYVHKLLAEDKIQANYGRAHYNSRDVCLLKSTPRPRRVACCCSGR